MIFCDVSFHLHTLTYFAHIDDVTWMARMGIL